MQCSMLQERYLSIMPYLVSPGKYSTMETAISYRATFSVPDTDGPPIKVLSVL